MSIESGRWRLAAEALACTDSTPGQCRIHARRSAVCRHNGSSRSMRIDSAINASTRASTAAAIAASSTTSSSSLSQ
jgi:hypothetical protein